MIRSVLSKYKLGNSKIEKNFKKEYKKYKTMSKRLGIKIHYEEDYNKRVLYIVDLKAAEDRLKESLSLLNNERVSQGKQPVIMDAYCDIL